LGAIEDPAGSPSARANSATEVAGGSGRRERETRPARSDPDQARDLLVLGEAILALLGEDQTIVDGHLEDTTAGFDAFHGGFGVGLAQLGSQTDRLREVVSLHAVLDRDFHGWVSGGGLVGRGALCSVPSARAKPPNSGKPTRGPRGSARPAGWGYRDRTPAREHRHPTARLAGGLTPTTGDTSRRPRTQPDRAPSVVGPPPVPGEGPGVKARVSRPGSDGGDGVTCPWVEIGCRRRPSPPLADLGPVGHPQGSLPGLYKYGTQGMRREPLGRRMRSRSSPGPELPIPVSSERPAGETRLRTPRCIQPVHAAGPSSRCCHPQPPHRIR